VARARASGDHVFRREGDGWRVVYGGQDAYVKHSEGMRYIAYLLANRDQEIGAVDLRSRFGTAESAAGGVSIDSDQAKSEGLSESGAERYDHIDDTARRQIRARRVEIDGERAEARQRGDYQALAMLDKEAKQLDQYLGAAGGLAGRTRHFPSDEERAADAARTAIRRARDAIRRHHLELARHLKETIRPGLSFSYTPGSPIEWDARP
jgi:hypothetical protein